MISIEASKSRSARIVAAAAAALSFSFLATAACAHEDLQWPLSGDQLKATWSNTYSRIKFQFKTKDQININSSSIIEDPREEGATLVVRGTGALPGNTGIIRLPAESWKRIGPEDGIKGWKFKSADPELTGGVTKVQIKSASAGGSLKIQAKGGAWNFQIFSPQDSVEIVLSLGTFSYCSEFSAATSATFDTNESGEIVAEDAQAPAGCSPVCGNGILEAGEECDDGNDVNNDTCSNTCEGCDPMDVEYPSTFAAIQNLIFDSPSYGCSADVCHGSGYLSNGELDLREGNSYDMLVGPNTTTNADMERVYPGDKDLSSLYLKLAEKVFGSMVVDGPGAPMPSGATPPLTEEHLEAIRLWIHSGASETGIVAGTAELLGSCLPESTPADIDQPEVPDPSFGTQFAMPGYNLESQSEVEGCVASYYDVSQTVPASMMVDCPGMFPGTNETGLNAGKCFSHRGNDLFQDAQSHHSIVHIYQGDYDWNDPGWGPWTCYGGDTPGAACDPTITGDCGVDGEGINGVCGGRFHLGVACLDTIDSDFGAPDFQTSNAPTFSGSQEPTAHFNFPNGVFNIMPLKGVIVWNSHAFNLTNQDTAMETWINMTYTDTRTWPAVGLFDNRWIFEQNVPPFGTQELCATHTFAEGTRLFQLSSHTHARGVRWRYYGPPQTPCSQPAGTINGLCLPGDEEDIFYTSYDYSDPVTINPDPPMHFTGTTANRTIKFCSLYDNGSPANPDLIKRQSTSPVPTGNLPIGGPCSNSEVVCLGGTNKGALCNGNDASCPGSVCDACPLRGGVTTEDEMYIAIGTFYLNP
jgi:cysteine-rich repeat protein